MEKQKLTKEEIQKKKRNIQIAAYVLVGLEFINVLYLVLYQFVKSIKANWYIEHLGMPLAILFVGFIAILLPIGNKYASLKSSNTYDKYISIGGIVLIFASIVMFIGSFM